MNTQSLDIIVEAKNEYSEELIDILTPYIDTGIAKIWDDAVRERRRSTVGIYTIFKRNLETDYSEALEGAFQDFARDVADEYFSSLLQAIFVLNTKVLSIIKVDANKISVTVPQSKVFFEKAFKAAAKEMSLSPMLYEDRETKVDDDRISCNRKEAIKKIRKSIKKAVRSFLPIKQILLETKISDTTKTDVGPAEKSESRPVSSNAITSEQAPVPQHVEKDGSSKSQHTHEMSEQKSQNNSSGKIKSINLPVYKTVRKRASIRRQNQQVVNNEDNEKFFSD
jgi:hypothetical protein